MLTQNRNIGEEIQSGVHRPATLAPGQMVRVIVIGLGIWFAAAMAVRFGGPAGFFGPTASVAAFAVALPVCWLSVLFAKRVAQLQAGQTLPGIALGTAAAAFCDGIGLTWGNGLYGSDPAQVSYGAAWILWGVGIFLLIAYLDDYRQTGKSR